MDMPLPPFQQFLDQHREHVYRFLLATVGPDDVDDCFQETFMSALKAYPRLRPDSQPRAWVLTIAHRKAIDVFRARKRQVPSDQLKEPATDDAQVEHEVWELVSRLPDKQRTAVAHRYVNDLPYAEIATVMGCSAEAARRSVHEGLKKLREVIA